MHKRSGTNSVHAEPKHDVRSGMEPSRANWPGTCCCMHRFGPAYLTVHAGPNSGSVRHGVLLIEPDPRAFAAERRKIWLRCNKG